MKWEKIPEKVNKSLKYSNKLFPRFLKYIGYIKESSEYETWIKETNTAVLRWIVEYLIVTPFIVFFCLQLTGLFLNHPNVRIILLAEVISIAWFLIIKFKQDLWRKKND